MRITLLAFTGIGLALVGCRSSNGNGDDTSGDAGLLFDAPTNGVTIQMVQNTTMPPGTAVSLYGKVVTAIDTFGTRTGNVWIEEPNGGAQSGVLVFGVGSAALATLAVGDLVSVTGAQKEEYTGSGDTSGNYDTELEPVSSGTLTMTKTGVGTVPTPVVVDALTLGMMAGSARNAAWQQYEGVLISLANVSENSSVKGYGSDGSDQHEFDITGDVVVEDELAAFAGSGLSSGTCLGNVTGIVDYFFNYNILPRSTADIATNGTGCPALETSCTDGVDNDGNGFTDCGDDNCIGTTASCSDAGTILAFDNAFDAGSGLGGSGSGSGNPESAYTGVGSNNGYTLSNVYVTAIGSTGYNFWVTDNTAGAGSANHGIYIFNGGGKVTGLVVGAKFDTLVGKIDQYNGGKTNPNYELEFDYLAGTIDAAAPIVPTAVATQTAATLTALATGKPYIGTLVTLTNVKVVTAGTTATHNVGSVSQTIAATTTTFESAGDATVIPATSVGMCYPTVTGIWIYDAFNQAFALEPVTLSTPVACT